MNDNFGLFLYSFVQISILLSTLVYTLVYLKRNNVKMRFIYLLLVLYALLPIFPMYAMTATKDVMYTAFVMLFIIEVHTILTNSNITKKRLIYIILLSILICLMRNNGIFIVIPTLFSLIFFMKENKIKIFIIGISTIIFMIIYSNIILPYFNISQTSKRETLSIPFQQTALYAKKYDNEVTQEEKDVINKVLNYDEIRKNYMPNISDPVKGTYNKYATNVDLKNYFRVWFYQFLKHPTTYIEATLNGIYKYIYPSEANGYIYHEDLNIMIYKIIANYGYSNFNVKFMDWHFNSLKEFRLCLVRNANNTQFNMLTGGIVNIAIQNWSLLLMIVYLIKNKKGKYVTMLIPSIMTFLVCIASPVNGSFRYALPIIFSNPFLGILIINLKDKNK